MPAGSDLAPCAAKEVRKVAISGAEEVRMLTVEARLAVSRE